MHKYQTIIAAIDFSDNTDAVIQKALSLATQSNAKIKILHVVEYTLPMDADYVMPPVNEVEDKLVEKAYKRLDALLKSIEESAIERIVVAGHPKQEILRIAERENADLLVVGSHGHHGLLGILGSTTDRVVHRAICDVLIVR